MRRAQLSFGDGLIREEVEDLREDWMIQADKVLEDEQLVATVCEALARRHPKSRSRGRRATPADVVLRLLVLKHVRNWSYQVLEREVRANLGTATSAVSAAPRCLMPRPWAAGAWLWDRRSSNRYMKDLSVSP